jgi:hypothetical protein
MVIEINCNYPCSERGESFSQLRSDSREASGGLQDFIPGSETNYATSSAYSALNMTANDWWYSHETLLAKRSNVPSQGASNGTTSICL